MSNETLPGQEIVRTSREREDCGGNDRRIKVAYASGFFDGEGWVSLSASTRQQPFVVIGAGQKTPAPLKLLQELWGNSINKSKDDIYRWRLTGSRAIKALEEMRDLLIVKQSQADIAIEFHKGLEPRPSRWSDAKERGRETTRRHRARQRGEDIKTQPRPRLSRDAFDRVHQYRERLYASRP